MCSFCLQSVQYFFTEFNLEPGGECYDSIKIYDGINSSAPLIGEFCHTTDVTESFKSWGTSIHFQFISDYSNEVGVSTGFRIVWNESKDQKR